VVHVFTHGLSKPALVSTWKYFSFVEASVQTSSLASLKTRVAVKFAGGAVGGVAASAEGVEASRNPAATARDVIMAAMGRQAPKCREPLGNADRSRVWHGCG
jgi:hypothetical protein